MDSRNLPQATTSPNIDSTAAFIVQDAGEGLRGTMPMLQANVLGNGSRAAQCCVPKDGHCRFDLMHESVPGDGNTQQIALAAIFTPRI